MDLFYPTNALTGMPSALVTPVVSSAIKKNSRNGCGRRATATLRSPTLDQNCVSVITDLLLQSMVLEQIRGLAVAVVPAMMGLAAMGVFLPG